MTSYLFENDEINVKRTRVSTKPIQTKPNIDADQPQDIEKAQKVRAVIPAKSLNCAKLQH